MRRYATISNNPRADRPYAATPRLGLVRRWEASNLSGDTNVTKKSFLHMVSGGSAGPAIRALIFLVQAWGVRYLLAVHATPPDFSAVQNALRVVAIDSPLYMGCAVALSMRFPVRWIARLWTATALGASIGLVLLNTISLSVATELGRLPTRWDVHYLFEGSFLSGSVQPLLLSWQTILFFFLPSGLLIGMQRIRRLQLHITGYRALNALLLYAVLAAALSLAWRRWGYANPISRRLLSSRSLYFHSLLVPPTTGKPLSAAELEQLDSLRTLLFFDSVNTGNRSRALAADSLPPPPRAPHILLIVMESFGAVYTDSVYNGIAVCPNLQKLKKHATVFTRCYSNSYMSSRALWSMLSGELSKQGEMMFLSRPDFHQPLVSDELAHLGYYNGWFHGNGQEFDNRGHVLTRHGFHGLFDRHAFPPPFEKVGWGIGDEELFVRSLHYLDSLVELQKPLFALFQTLSNHHPYAVPRRFERFNTVKNIPSSRFLNGLHYSDHCLGVLFDSLCTRPWFTNTIVIVTADNGLKPQRDFHHLSDEVQHYFHIPLLILDPQHGEAAVDSMPVSQLDIGATILSRARGSSQRYGLGYDLLAAQRPPFVPVVNTFLRELLITPQGVCATDQQCAPPQAHQLSQLKIYMDLWSRLLSFGQEQQLLSRRECMPLEHLLAHGSELKWRKNLARQTHLRAQWYGERHVELRMYLKTPLSTVCSARTHGSIR